MFRFFKILYHNSKEKCIKIFIRFNEFLKIKFRKFYAPKKLIRKKAKRNYI